MKRIKAIIFSVVFTLPLLSYTQIEESRLIGLEAQIDSLMEVYHTVGLSVAIVENNELIYSKGFGFRDLEKKLPVTTKTLFGIGSISKQFTASLLGKYQGEGKLSFDDKPSKHVKGLKFHTAEMDERIRIRELLTHTSGIGTVDGAHVFFPTDDPDQHLARLPYLVPNSEIGRGVDYANMGYVILGEIGAKITGRSWSQNIIHDLFEPLDMQTSTTSFSAFLKSPEYALPYSVSNGSPVQVLPEDQHENSAAGAISSNVLDMANWLKMLLNQGQFEETQVLPTDFLEAAWSAYTPFPAFAFGDTSILDFNMSGYGWFVQNFRNYYKVNHSGATSGYTANLDLYPNENLGLIVLTNQHSTGIVNVVSDLITTRMLELESLAFENISVRYAPARNFESSINPINQEHPPTLPLADYVGVYENKGYGKLEISLKGEHLEVSLPAFTLALSHHEDDTFYSQPLGKTHENNPSFNYVFLHDEKGRVRGLSISMQHPAVRFEKLR